MKYILIVILFLNCIKGWGGEPSVVDVPYSKTPVVIDGVLDDAVWKEGIVYKLYKFGVKEEPVEKGEIRFAWDKDYFYLATKFYGKNIYALGQKDQIRHYNYGDLVELFLKPEGASWYWELYATPLSKKTTFWFTSRLHRGKLSIGNGLDGLDVASRVTGTVNNGQDDDQYWTSEMRFSTKYLAMKGEGFGENSHWRVFVGRYNYVSRPRRYHRRRQFVLTSFPCVPKADFHCLKHYAVIRFIK